MSKRHCVDCEDHIDGRGWKSTRCAKCGDLHRKAYQKAYRQTPEVKAKEAHRQSIRKLIGKEGKT